MNKGTKKYLENCCLIEDTGYFDESEIDVIDEDPIFDKVPEEINEDENHHCLKLLNVLLTCAIDDGDKDAVKDIRKDIQKMKEKLVMARKLIANNISDKESLAI